MRTALLSVIMLSIAVPAAPVLAKSDKAEKEWHKAERKAAKHDRKHARSAARDWREYRSYDYNRYEPGASRYYADRYYRDASYYQPRQLVTTDRVYRGQNGQYYCRRPDGTTGLIIGGLAGGVLGNAIAPGGSKTLGTLLGAVAGGLGGRAIDRSNVRCN